MREERPVGPVSLLALGVNGIVGVGIFFAPADVAARAPGGASVLVFLLTALALQPVALTFAALGARFDEDGGPVVFARAAFGRLVSFLVGWIAYVSAVASATAVHVGLVSAVFPGRTPAPLATALVTLLALLCATGLRFTARTWTAVTVLKLLPLAAVVAAWIAAGAPLPGWPGRAPDVGALLSAGLVATFAYQGFEIVPVLAGQAVRSGRTVPLATVGSLLLAAALYLCLQAACAAALPDLAGSGRPIADAALVYGGPRLQQLAIVGTSVSALGIALGMVAATPHYLAALARGTLGGGLADVSSRGVPWRALLLTWVAVVVLIQLGSRADLFAFASVAVLTQYVVSAAALGVLAWRREVGLTRGYLAVAVPAAIVGASIVAGATTREFVSAGAALVVGALLRAVARVRPPADAPRSPAPPPAGPATG